MAVHLVYAGHLGDGRIQAPYSITQRLYDYLAERTNVRYHLWDATAEVDIKPEDVVVGHPNYPENTTVQRIFRSGLPCKAKCTIHPLHTRRVEDNMPFDNISKAADIIFAICGPYWIDTIGETPFAHWAPKIVRLDMAVDPVIFPYLRQRFNQPRKRKLVYVGSSMPQKNLGLLTAIMSKMRDVQLDWYGGDSAHPLAKLPNVRAFGWTVLDRIAAQKIVNECDIFVNTSISDANPTTILEAAAWGLPMLATKESGYWPNRLDGLQIGEIVLDDVNRSVANIRDLLGASDDQLFAIAKHNRHAIQDRYTWERFCSTVWSHIQQWV